VSVLDEFRAAEQRVAQRMKELEPAVAEYRELEIVAQRLGIDVPAATPPRTTRRRRRKSSATDAGRNATGGARRTRRTQPGKRDDQLLALVRERPGVTVAEAAKAMSVDPTGLYRVVGRLEQRGEVRKDGRQLQPVTQS
jgi:hypothetical protein